MSLISLFPVTRHVYRSPASSRRDAPFAGINETEFCRVWNESWDATRAHVLSQAFVDQLGPNPNALTLTALVESYIDRGGDFLLQLEPTLEALVNRAGAGVTKAKLSGDPVNPFRAGTPAWARWRYRNSQGPATVRLDPETRYANLAKNLTLSMVEGITAKMKTSVRSIIADGFRRGQTAAQVSQRVGSVLGLNSRWAKAVENLRASMITKGISPRQIDKRVAAYGKELLVKRGIMVARTEMARAENAGRQEFWQMSRDAGEIADYRVVKHWMVREGACPECVAAADSNSAGVPDDVEGLDTPFSTPYGDVLYPPLHPHCRCYISYELVSPTK